MGSADARREAYLGKVRSEVAELARRGVVTSGNAFSPVLVAKGDVGASELSGALLAGEDGAALRAALVALGYAPEEWCALATVAADGTPLDAETMRLAVATLDPDTLIACDEAAAAVVREAYADDLAELPSIEAAALSAGLVARAAGMRVLNLGGFSDALASPASKQRVWAYLKQVPPLGEPF